MFDQNRDGGFFSDAKKPAFPSDEQSLILFLDWLLLPPDSRMRSYPFNMPIPKSSQEFVKSLLRPLSYRKFCDKLLKRSPKQFELLVADFFKRLGCEVTMSGNGPDGGIDLTINTLKRHYVAQCKRWKDKVGVATTREVYGLAANSLVKGAFIVVTSEFTSEAIYFTKNLKPRVGLIDGREFYNLMSQLSPAVVQEILDC